MLRHAAEQATDHGVLQCGAQQRVAGEDAVMAVDDGSGKRAYDQRKTNAFHCYAIDIRS